MKAFLDCFRIPPSWKSKNKTHFWVNGVNSAHIKDYCMYLHDVQVQHAEPSTEHLQVTAQTNNRIRGCSVPGKAEPPRRGCHMFANTWTRSYSVISSQAASPLRSHRRSCSDIQRSRVAFGKVNPQQMSKGFHVNLAHLIQPVFSFQLL